MSRKNSTLKLIWGAVLFILFLGRKLKRPRDCSNFNSSHEPTLLPEPTAPQFDPPSAPQFDPPSAPQFDPPSAPQFDPPSVPQFDPPSTPQFDWLSDPQFDLPSTPSYAPASTPILALLASIAKSAGGNSPSSKTAPLENSLSVHSDYVEQQKTSSRLLSSNYDDEEDPSGTLATDYDQLEESRLPRFMWGA